MSAAPAPRTIVARARLASQGLLPVRGHAHGRPDAGEPDAGQSRADPAGAVRRLLLVQAQDFGQAFWALGVRTPGADVATVRAAFDAGAIVRTWAARGTLMLAVPGVLDDVLAVTAPRMRAQTAAVFRHSGITADDLAALAPVALRRSAGGATRSSLLEAFREAGQPTAGQRGYHLLMGLSLERVIVQGPMAAGGAGQLFVPYRNWLEAAQGRTRHDGEDPAGALERLAVGYFTGHGPATESDFAWWLGVPLTPVRAALAAAGADGRLVRREVSGSGHWMAPGTAAVLDAGGPGPGARSLVALPGFDEYLLGYRDRSATLPAQHAARVVPGGNGVFRRTIIRGGATVGTWSAEGRPEPFGADLGPAVARAFAARMRAYSRFWAR